ncbi:MAG: YgiQ family radical SAM protein [Thiobacillus sp. 63-78]|uniref:YgiQ family radical SAM protein n=1 Tax=Thiobacillus sp. 63-78 TaxID=1895859 RepID=UPI000959F55B|nr:YgiQ family radical SAM protein [Thiobacillus sp. 63-78]OJZ06596.1 MAG: YgiQ family radical SAM protein [Thiobacillus sp. 63-78]
MTQPLFSHRKHWAARFGTAPFLPMSRAEMAALGWDACDVILITGDAYIDHPSFGMALVGRLLEAQGYRVGIISQPDWHSADAFRALGQPTLYFGVTAGNMDSMVNRYTADRKIRSDDAYTAHAEPNKRPDRAVTVYAQRCREAFPGTPVIIGSIEASLRRIAHYDYWSDTVRRSVLPDSKADLLIFGNAERALLEITHRLARGEKIGDIRDVRGTGFMVARDWLPSPLPNPPPLAGEGAPQPWIEVLSTELSTPGAIDAHVDPYAFLPSPASGGGAGGEGRDTVARASGGGVGGEGKAPAPQTPAGTAPLRLVPRAERLAMRQEIRARTVIRLPDYDQVKNNPVLYAHASRVFHLESNPGNARALRQAHGERDVWLNPPPIPLTTPEMDAVYDLPYARAPHPSYGDAKIPAWEMIRFSINIMRGCFGGCTFCSITEHEGRVVQSRSEDSVIREIEAIRDKTPGFTGVISDLGGPTANMYRLACKSKEIERSCRKLSCVFPDICDNLNTDHAPLIQLYRRARQVPGIKKIQISSGLRYDLAVRSPEYVKELVQHHVGGYLKIAPEHTEAGPLSKMMKPGMGTYERFREMFEAASRAVGKKQYLIPYFIAAHPGTTDEDMLNLALWLKQHDFRLDQVQTFLPTPMALATAMYHTEKNPLKKVLGGKAETVPVVRQGRTRRLHKAFLRYHDPDNWPLLREALKEMGRADLIGNSRKHLIPLYQPAGTGGQPEGARARPGAGKPDAAKAGAGKPAPDRPAPAGRGRPPQVPRHPLSQRRGGGKTR